ncbi:MAG TPA: cell wall-binding repeat-containing protein [Euzebya sp.]|nr:cell wall-binding repeat-containing protein [Euzebya sp.]
MSHDQANDRLFAAIGTSGVWLSEDLGESWTSIGDGLPTNIASAVSWTPNGGPDGTVVVLTGEHTFGGASFTGLGAFWSTDLGATWTRAEGPPDGTLGFAIEVDPTDPDVVYAATGRGLWRSADVGRTYVDVELPVGTCQGDYNIDTCNYAHFVTDVVLKQPGGVGADTAGGTVVAAVGYRAGTLEDVSGEFVHSEGNGIYTSATGQPGTFEHLPGLEDAVGGHERIGRIELGPAVGAEQDHDILYAIVQDAVLFNGGVPFDPVPLGAPLGANPTVFNGAYFSDDFGATWTLLADDQEMSTACPSNQSVFCIPGLIEPGIQSWYNMWIEPDPTRQVGGVPTRVLLGLEEVWQNRVTDAPADNPSTSFEVIGAYYGGADCLLVATDCGVSGNAGITTTHPDQHDGIYIPTLGEDGEPDGGVRLLVGHDGGLSSQVSTGTLSEFSQDTWILEQENGLDTLLPYAVAVANDGTAVSGLQDNGTIVVLPEEDHRQFEVLGADGTIAAIDPEDSDYAYVSSQGHGLMSVTSDGFETRTSLTPVPADNILFVPPFGMNPLNTDHVITGGTQVVENLGGRQATTSSWEVVFDLGTSERQPLVETDAAQPPRQTSAVAAYGDAAYVGFCSPCHILQSAYPFDSGIATNVGRDELPEPGTGDGWHIAAAEGLPKRYVTSLAVDLYDPTGRTVYATLGGYARQWAPPGTGADEAEGIGEGHVFVSRDAGETFSDISGNLPDTPALWVEPRHDQLLVGTDIGPFISADTAGTRWAPLAGDGFPAIPVNGIQLQADDPQVAYLSVYGRGVMRYDFPQAVGEVRRVAGDVRETTAIAISQEWFQTADTVVLARSDDYADALAGSPVAFAEEAPLLLTGTTGLDDRVAAEIRRLGATSAVLLGDTAALSQNVETELASETGVTDVRRLAGPNRFATAAAIASELAASSEGPMEAWIVKGNDADPTRGWPDAMSIAPIAARAGQPILLTETDRLPTETVAAITDADIVRGRIVGGTAAVEEDIEDQLADHMTIGDRLAGPNRFATSVAVAVHGLRTGHALSDAWLARADEFADALTAGPTVAAGGGTLLLVDSASLEASLDSGIFLQDRTCDVDLARILGGTAAISDALLDEVRGLMAVCPIGIPDPPEQEIVPGEPAPDPIENAGEIVAGPFGFEADAEGWTVATDGNPATAWSRGEPGHDSEQSFQVVPYLDEADTSLVSPEITVAGERVTVAWWHTLDVEGGGFDELAVEWTVDGGTTWRSTRTFGGQNADHPAFSQQLVSFTPPAGTVQIRFRLFSDFICSSAPMPDVCATDSGWEGVRVDDVTIFQ